MEACGRILLRIVRNPERGVEIKFEGNIGASQRNGATATQEAGYARVESLI